MFRVRDSMGRPVTAEARWTKVSDDLEAVVSGRIKAEILVAGRPRTESVASWKTPAVPTECKIDNIVSRDFTVVEVITEDRPGVLYAIARALYVAGLDIHRSKIATEANRAIDVFYVRDKATMDKIIDPERQASLRDTLLALLAGGDSDRKLRGQRVASVRNRRCRSTILMRGAAVAGRGRRGGAAAREGREAVPPGRRRGRARGVRRGGQGRSQGRAPALPEGRRAGEEGRQRRRDGRLQAGDQAARPTSPRRTTTWARCCSRRTICRARRASSRRR